MSVFISSLGYWWIATCVQHKTTASSATIFWQKVGNRLTFIIAILTGQYFYDETPFYLA